MKRDTCPDCGQEVIKVPYRPDLTKTPPRGFITRVPLDPKPAADQDDPAANYGVSIGRTWCHLITADWPLADNETRHHTHHQTCPARRSTPAAAGPLEGEPTP